MNADRKPIVLPDGRQLKLWQSAISGLRLEGRRGLVVREGFEKYFVAPTDAVGDPPWLTAIYQLQDNRPPFRAGIEALALPDTMRMLEALAYRPGLRRQLTSTEQMVSQTAAVARHVPAFRLVRSLQFGLIDATVDTLLQHWQELDR
jgi:hypothetical protein